MPLIDTADVERQRARRKIFNNVSANYVGAVLNAVLPLLTLPIYFNALGADRWGLVSFVSFFVSALSILAAGFSQALVKEFANRRGSEAVAPGHTANLLLGYERVYAGFALAVCLLVLPFADTVVTRWLDLGSLTRETGLLAVYCACAMFLGQFPGSIYRTVLIARQEQVRLNQIQIFFMLLRHGVSVLLVLHTGDVSHYLVWQVICTVAESLWTSMCAWREVGQSRRASRWDATEMRSTFRFAAVMAVSVLLGAATTMIDKFYIAASLPIAQLGYYGIASSLSFGVLRLSYPVFTAILPRLVDLRDDPAATLKINLNLLFITIVALLAGGVAYWAFGRVALQMWIRNDDAVVGTYGILTLLLASSALNVIYNIGYTNWVATGQSRIILAINIAAFVSAVLITPLAINRLGLLGAGAALILMSLIGASVSLSWLLKCRLQLQLASISGRLP